MTSKERVLSALRQEKPDRVPFNFWMDRRLMEQYEHRLGQRHWRVEHYGADVVETFPLLNFPAGRSIEKDGSHWITEPYFTDWRQHESIPLPEADSDGVYSLIDLDLREYPDKAVFLDVVTPWGIIAGLRMYENTYTDMYEYPDEFLLLAARIQNVLKTVVDKACKRGVTALYIMEDLATSAGLAFSPKMIQRFCLDFAAELADIAHEYGIPVLFHSDGKAMQLAGLLQPIGISAINPLQPHLNDYREFAEKYGGKLSVYGGLDNCFVIPDGSPAEIRKQVLDAFEVLGKPCGGLIFSSHDIPAHTPPENIDALVNAIKECIY